MKAKQVPKSPDSPQPGSPPHPSKHPCSLHAAMIAWTKKQLEGETVYLSSQWQVTVPPGVEVQAAGAWSSCHQVWRHVCSRYEGRCAPGMKAGVLQVWRHVCSRYEGRCAPGMKAHVLSAQTAFPAPVKSRAPAQLYWIFPYQLATNQDNHPTAKPTARPTGQPCLDNATLSGDSLLCQVDD
jgi:hypothetical protein